MTPHRKARRVRDPALLLSYRRLHPSCEVLDCREFPCPEPHHLVSRALGGSDSHDNLLRLCVTHHVGRDGWHSLGKYAWWRRMSDRLLPEARAKVARALGLEDP